MEDKLLAELLSKACPRPSFLAASPGGPILALALHCLMVNEGFVLAMDAASRSAEDEARLMPPKDWNGMYMDQWIFEYRKPGKANKFILHCSLQARTKRMFIHASEENNSPNVAVLGLQLENYVPDPTRLKSNTWLDPEPAARRTSTPGPASAPSNGAFPAAAAKPAADRDRDEGLGTTAAPREPTTAVVNAAKMRDLLYEHVVQKILADSEDLIAHPEGGDSSLGGGQIGRSQEPKRSALAWWRAPVLASGSELPGPFGRVTALQLVGTAAVVVVAAAVAVAVARGRVVIRPRSGGSA